MTPDRHLGSATIDAKLRPTLLITETTYATTIRGSKRMREGTVFCFCGSIMINLKGNFLKKVHATVNQGGKVLIPGNVFFSPRFAI
jgi:integrator complex subunit 11